SDNWSPGWGWSKTQKYTGGSMPEWLVQEARNLATAGAVRDSTATSKQFGAGIYANSLVFDGGSVKNIGSPYSDNRPDSTVTVTGTIDPASVAAAGDISLGDFDDGSSAIPVTLPTNPNGYFIVSQDPDAGYLVETNPLFVNGDLLGSDMLTDLLGLDVDEIGMRLGDAAYEAYLIRQQLINTTGRNLLAGYASEQAMLAGLYSAAAEASASLGLVWGEALTDEQVSQLTDDIVWMVETEVNGRTVLAPVVYLSEATRAGIRNGAVMDAGQIVMDVHDFTNVGGDVAARDHLQIVSEIGRASWR